MADFESKTGNVDRERTARSYRAGGRFTRERLQREAPESEEALRAVEHADIVVVQGCFDHVERVLGVLDLPFTTISPDRLDDSPLRPEQLLVVNCPGQVGARALARVTDFVAAGGSLFTTDWALRHVLEPAFPGVLAFNDRPTRDDVVRIEVRSKDNPFLQGVLETGDDPQRWLERSSYPIRILQPERVEVLLASRELGERYGESPVAVLFRHGEGEVFHMISHYYLQRTELRTARHQSTSAALFAEKGIESPALRKMADGLTLGEVEAASSSTRLLANLVARKKLRAQANERSQPR